MGTMNLTADVLSKSALKLRKTLLAMIVIGLEDTKKHMTVRPGIRYKEVVGQLSGGIEIGPYSDTRIDTSGVDVTPRELETFFGSVVKEFSPNAVYQSVWGSSITKGEGLKSTEVVDLVLAYLMKKLSESLNKNVWSAVRNAGGDKTKDLFNGFDTIAQTEITAGKLTKELKNLYSFTEAIDSTNAVDQLKDYYRFATDELQMEDCKLFIPKSIYNAYVDDYQSTVGSIVYNKEFDKLTLESSKGRCELLPLANKAGSNFIQLTPKSNMLIGVDQESDLEKIIVEKHAAFTLQFIATLFFGCQYETISPEKLLVGKLFTE